MLHSMLQEVAQQFPLQADKNEAIQRMNLCPPQSRSNKLTPLNRGTHFIQQFTQANTHCTHTHIVHSHTHASITFSALGNNKRPRQNSYSTAISM